MTFLRDDVTAETLTEIQTDASGLLNITGDLSVGVANQGKVATHALCKVQTDGAATGSYMYGAFYGTQGEVLCPVQGGGSKTTGLPALATPVRMQSGVQLKVEWQANGTGVQQASVAVVCASGKADIFHALAVDDTDVSMVNKDGNTWGEALAGQVVKMAYATYSSTDGLADTGVADGIDAFFVESASGQLLGLYAPSDGYSGQTAAPYIAQPIRVSQNDTLTVRANI